MNECFGAFVVRWSVRIFLGIENLKVNINHAAAVIGYINFKS